ncbi:hypothetical protein [Streptomyces sp. HPF1205]|uniref:hypothetical protein n=1 Tax=Streptomyces sp. HPF1205 TaxID=2873262 RepID=UPI001CED6A24|nr:hypothetical protein [Streptomyces sp. HPF1205]
MHDRYHVDANPPLSPPGTPRELLEALADALNASGNLVQDALDELTPDLVELAFNSINPKERQRLLRNLGINLAAPRRASKSLCQDVLTRMRRELKQHGCTCATRVLVGRVMNDVAAAVGAEENRRPVVDPVTRWNSALARLAVFTWCQASAFDAKVLLWAAERQWLGLGADINTIKLDAVREAAARVVEVTSSFAQDSTHQVVDGADRLLSAKESVAAQPLPEAVENEPASGTASGDPLGTADNGEYVDPYHAYEALKVSVSTAQDAITRIAGALEDGSPPIEEDLRDLSAVVPAFVRIRDALAAVGTSGVPLRLNDLAQAVEAHRAERDRDHAVRERLHILLAVTCHGAASVALFAAQELALHLREKPLWDESERSQAEALIALAEIVELSGRPDALPEIMKRQQLVGRTLPECAMAALMYTELSLPAETANEDARTEPVVSTVSELPPASAMVESSSSSSPSVDTPGPVAEVTPSPLPASPVAPGSLESPLGADDMDTQASAEVDTSAASGNLDAAPDGAEPMRQPALPDERPTAAASVDAAHLVIDGAVVRLVSERRFGLAAHISSAAGRSEAESAALRLAAAGAALRPGSGSGARLVDEALQRWDVLGSRGQEGTELLLLPALARSALITGEHMVGAQLRALAPRLPVGLAEIAVAVGDRALSGALLIARPMAVIAGVSATEAGLREAVDQVQALCKPPRLRFNRATHIAKRWLAEDGMLGEMLLSIANGLPDTDVVVRETIGRLTRLSEVHAEIDKADRELRGPSSRPLQGPGRQDLVQLVERSVDCAKAWLDVTEALKHRKAADSTWAVQEISAMRESVLNRQDNALRELERAAGRPYPFAAAAALAGHISLTEFFRELEHGTTVQRLGTEVDAYEAINAELLKIPAVPGQQPSLEDLLAAVDRTWDEALELQVAQDDFSAGHRILDLAACGALPGAAPAYPDTTRRAWLQDLESRRASELTRRREELLTELRGAQADGALSDDQDVALQELLADADAGATEDGTPRELSSVRRNLDLVAQSLPQYRKEAADRLRARLDALPKVTDDERAQVLRHLDTDGLATAADLVYFLELGEQVPEILTGESHLRDFYPSVPTGLSDGITKALVTTARNGSRVRNLPALDYGRLSTDEAARAAHALEQWRNLAIWEPKDRQNAPLRDLLLPALSLLGYEARRARPLHELPRSNEYRFVDVSDIQINGRAWAPAFGSKILEQGGRLRVLMVWGRPSAQLLLSRATREPSGESLLVAYFGTLSTDDRAALAASVGRAPLMVVDDAALAYLAARGNRQVSVATETLLPFSGVNPYIKEKRGRIGREMFYGRDAERKSILDPDGTQIIFGGRGLGKSALLNDAGDRFAEQQPTYHRPVYINLDHHNIGKGTALGPETIWNVLDAELTSLNVLPQKTRRQFQTADPFERVRSGIKEWLDSEAQHRLLILMDECDRFFEADAPHCTQTRRLKGLCVETRGRLKVVFAGLHSVQRFTRLARNGPFSHLAQTPTVVGPLAPQFAADLLTLPMRALGFEFADVDLVNRVLGYCSYQPFLLQMFGSRLVEGMQRKRARREGSGLPFSVEAEDVQAVESDPSLRADITAAFKDTLTLDDRYNVIANVLARHARDNGLEARLTDIELRDECSSWWPVGFRQLDSEGFRAYLQEMVGLGILAPNHDGRGWHLRGPNALRMIGTAQEVETRLLSAESECRLEETVVLEGRPELHDGRSAPLTVTQVNDLLGDHANQTRIVLGTPATGIGDVSGALRAVTDRIGWKMPSIGTNRLFRQELSAGRPGERRLVVSDLAALHVNEAGCRESLELARNVVPDRPGVTRAVVLVAGVNQLGLWRDLLSDPEAAASTSVVLRRYDRHGLKSWTHRSELFDTESQQSRLFEVTGGWPLVLDWAIELHEKSRNQDQALQALSDELQKRACGANLVDAAGLAADPLIAAAYRAVAEEFGSGWTTEDDLLVAMELAGLTEEEARWACACLDAFQVLEQEGLRRRLEPVLFSCWSRI